MTSYICLQYKRSPKEYLGEISKENSYSTQQVYWPVTLVFDCKQATANRKNYLLLPSITLILRKEQGGHENRGNQAGYESCRTA